MAAVDSVAAVREAVLGADRVLPRGGGTKPALSEAPDPATVSLELGGLSGIVSYNPSEFTFTARAGTPIAEIEAELAAQGQELPFDPLLGAAGATIGGTVATGVSGPGALGKGVVRDFVIGATVIDGCGRLISGGGRVVKNAAGFDLPKVLVGSAGRLGVITELSCKVFPRSQAQATVALECESVAGAVAIAEALARGPLEIEALDVEPPGRLLARIGGLPELLDSRVERLASVAGVAARKVPEAADFWRRIAELDWVPADSRLVAIAVRAADVARLDGELDAPGMPRRYCLGAGLALVAWPAERPPEELSALLARLGRAAVVLTGPPLASPLLGGSENEFGRRVRRALDPDERFLELWP